MTRTIFLMLAAVGCTPGWSDPNATTVPAAPSLAQPLQATAGKLSAKSAVSFDVASWKDDSQTHLDLAPSDLRLVLRTGRHGEITGLELPLADEDISAQALPPSGLKLRNLQLGLDDSATVETLAASEDFLELHAEAPLRLAWSVVLSDGSVYALGPAVTSPLSFDVQIERSGEDVTATVYALCTGDCWMLDGLARISNGQLHLIAPVTIKSLD